MNKSIKPLMLAGLLTCCTSVIADENKSYRAYDSPVNYSYLQFYVGGGHIDPDSDAIDEDNLTELGLSYQRMLSEHWIGELDYEGHFIHGDKADLRNDRAAVRGLYRISLNDKSDVLFGAKLGVMRTKATRRSDDSTISSDTDFMYGISAEYRYGFSKKWEGGLGVEYTDADHLDETQFTADIVYYSSDKFGFGGYVSEAIGDKSNTTAIGLKARFRF
ncbi:outer membrane beta-barrel protein [Vibrio sp. HN007]|uniref:outer membrane beta-barrel protein n=1 Tax=Vibrio iocasae TaxID=3098914 RepID=UPI0035D4D8F1